MSPMKRLKIQRFSPLITVMKVHCSRYLLLNLQYSRRLKQFHCRHITNNCQSYHTAVGRNNASFKITTHKTSSNLHWFHSKLQKLQSFEHCQLRFLSGSSCKFNELISPANKQRVQKNLPMIEAMRHIPLKKSYKKAAILVPMCMVDGELSLLLTLRSIHLRNHRGEVSFPGGMMDENDADVTVTALRETHEEIGLDPKLVDVWGSMQSLPNRAATSEITPVIGFCGNIDMNSLQINPKEVEKIFSLTIKELCDPKKQRTTQMQIGKGYTVPVYLSNSHRIWGLTAAVIFHFLSLLAPDLHRFKIKHQRYIVKIK